MNVTLLTIYDKGEISNVKDEFIEFLIKTCLQNMALLLENEEQEITKYRDETLYTHEISLISNIIALRIYIQE